MDCIKYRERLELKPKYVIHPSTQTKIRLEEEFTHYGDSISVPYRSVDELLEIVQNYPKRDLNKRINELGIDW